MRGKSLVLTCVIGVAGIQSGSSGPLYLTGWAEFGGVSRALITELPENRTWVVRSDCEVGGLKLERLEIPRGRAQLRRGNEIVILEITSGRMSADPLANFLRTGDLPPNYPGPWPSGYEPAFIRSHRQGQPDFNPEVTGPGHPASARYVGALRAYARSLPESERAAIDNELAHYSAGALQAGDPDQLKPDTGVTRPNTTEPAQHVAEQASSVTDANALFLKELLGSSTPEIGSLLGTGTDSQVPRLRQLLRNATDPVIELRLRQQLDGYASPPIAPYVRNDQGEWTDPVPATPGG